MAEKSLRPEAWHASTGLKQTASTASQSMARELIWIVFECREQVCFCLFLFSGTVVVRVALEMALKMEIGHR